MTQFGDKNIFNWPDSGPLSHEVDEWTNDPTTSNYVTAYSVGSPPYCQGTYDVGDILPGVFIPPVTAKMDTPTRSRNWRSSRISM